MAKKLIKVWSTLVERTFQDWSLCEGLLEVTDGRTWGRDWVAVSMAFLSLVCPMGWASCDLDCVQVQGDPVSQQMLGVAAACAEGTILFLVLLQVLEALHQLGLAPDHQSQGLQWYHGLHRGDGNQW
ncbi:Protein of unknown function [Gryllus bimaculatus]|nr:Protein of unknown function [Gryllus bimaculatus]